MGEDLLAQHVSVLAAFLARRDPVQKADVIVLLGNAIPSSASVAAEFFRQGIAPKILVSGGIGHSTSFLYEMAARTHPQIETAGKAEAEILAEILSEQGVPDEAILIENLSTNCGANAIEARKVLDAELPDARSLLLIQDPTMQRRSHASFERVYEDRPNVDIRSWSPFVPRVQGWARMADVPDDAWTWDRFLSLALGEIPRLRNDANGYGPNGKDFIPAVEIPTEVEASFAAITEFVGNRNPANDRSL